jgi:hypothetical protein
MPHSFSRSSRLYGRRRGYRPRSFPASSIHFPSPYTTEHSDKRSAIDWLSRAIKLEPKRSDLAAELGHELAMALLGIARVRNGRFYAGAALPDARSMVEHSTHARAVYQAVETLLNYALRIDNPLRTVTEDTALGEAWLARARAMDPSNPESSDEPDDSLAGLKAAYPAYSRRLRAIRLPEYGKYPAGEVYTGSPAAPRLAPDDDPNDRSVWAIRDAAKHGPDFAGHYRFAVWSCGERHCWTCVQARSLTRRSQGYRTAIYIRLESRPLSSFPWITVLTAAS